MKNILIALIALVLIGGGVYYFLFMGDTMTINQPDEPEVPAAPVTEDPMPVEPDGGIGDGAEPLPPQEGEAVIGTSVDGTDIVAHHFGTGDTEVLFVGGTHSGFSPNTVAVAQSLIDALEDGSINVPPNLRVTVIPNLNPDADRAVNQLAGRLNSNDVDLNRNFDCEWQAQGVWQQQPVSGGSAPFSEPEARAVRDYVQSRAIDAAVVYYASAPGVYSSSCRNGILPTTAGMTTAYAEAAGYPAFDEFEDYAITGDMVNWMAGEDIPAISVLLTDHQNAEWAKNRAGIEAVLNYLAR